MSSSSKFYFGQGQCYRNAANENSLARFQWGLGGQPDSVNEVICNRRKTRLRRRRRHTRRMPQRRAPAKGHRLGRITKNPFLNFLRDFRRRHTDLTCVQIACEGGKEWRNMNDDQKQQYYAQGVRLAGRKDKKARSPTSGSLPKVTPRHSRSPRRSVSKSM